LQSECASAKRERGQLEGRVNELKSKVTDLEDQVAKVSASRKAALAIAEEMGNKPSVTQNSSLKVAVEALAAVRPTPCPHIGNDFSQRGCQTLDTSFAPCGACHEAQSHIRKNGEVLIDICKRMEVPPSAYAAAQKGQITREGWLNAKELAEFNEEQGRCLIKLGTCLENKLKELKDYQEAVDILEGRIKDAATSKEKLNEEFNGDRNTWVIEKKNYAAKIEDTEKKCAARIKDMQTYVNKTLTEKDKANINERKAKEDVAMRERLIATVKEDKKRIVKENEALESEMSRMREQLEKSEDDLKKILGEREMAQVEKESAQKAMRKMDATMSVLDKKASSLRSQEETFLRRIDQLTAENENLLKELEEAETRVEKLGQERESGIGAGGVARVEEAERRMRALEKQVAEMASDRKESEAMIAALKARLQEAKDQQRLLVTYPDLNGPVNLDDVSSSGPLSYDSEVNDNDVASDMRKQLKANILRIDVLQDENERLQDAIAKMSTTVEEAKILNAIHRSESRTSVPAAPDPPLSRSVSHGNIAMWSSGGGGAPSAPVRSVNSAVTRGPALSAAQRLAANAPPPRRSISENQGRPAPVPPPPTTGFGGLPINAFNMSDEVKENITRPAPSINGGGGDHPPPIPLPPKRSASKVSVVWGPNDMRGRAENGKPAESKSATLPRNSRIHSAPSGGKPATAAVDAYRQLKQTGYVKEGGGRPPTAGIKTAFTGNNGGGRPKSGKKGSVPNGLDVGFYSCPKCDKMYPSTKDLDVHKIYCLNALATNF